ncbi:glycosyltransferase [Candidatus Micrarchaeota archaeon]|nr:glycosyltransferase [Candidatus Micrarchaeota archaeon]
MNRVLFAVTELQKPVGGLHRFTTELIPEWSAALKDGKTLYAPLPVSMKLPSVPNDDLVLSKEFADFNAQQPHVKVFEGTRAGTTAYFLESKFPQTDMDAFYRMLWDEFRIPSHQSSHDSFYADLAQYWKALPLFAEHAIRRKKWRIALFDAQDWLAFPAGFLCRKHLGIPLHCRFHSGEFGRSLGQPDLQAAPVWIEAVALQEADAISGVSAREAQFEIYRLLPYKRKLRAMLSESRGHVWTRKQEDKEEAYEYFLLFESEDGMTILTQHVLGIPNGILLDDWKKVPARDIQSGKSLYRKLLPNAAHYVFFIGRADWRKGIDALLRAISFLNREDIHAGLMVSSRMDPETRANYSRLAHSLGITDRVCFYNEWLSEPQKKSLFCAADVIALPSLYEPFGLVTLEGLAADLACEKNKVRGPVVVTSDTGGMSGIIRNGVNGFKVPVEEDRFDLQPELLSKILKLSLSDKRLKARMSKGGAARVQNPCFSWKHIVPLIFSAYDHAVENHALENR